METVVRRHKTLGAWVPLWVAGPCRNPECGVYEAQDTEGDRAGEDTRTAEPPRTAEDPAPPATTPREDAPGETVVESS